MYSAAKQRSFIKFNMDNVECICNPCFLEIWMGKLPDSSGSVQSGNRPLLIVSNDKNNKFSPNVNVMPLTTKINKRNLPCHVVLENFKEFGLTAPSTIMVEQLTTVQKENLLYKMGKIENKETLTQIYRAMQIQFPFV